MEPLFSIEYSEYCVADTLSKLLYTPKQFNVSVFVPTSRQEKGIDLMLYRHEDATCHNFTATIQVKSSRVYSLSEEEIQKSTGECQSYCDIQHMRDHISRTCQYNLNRKQCRCYKQEGKL